MTEFTCNGTLWQPALLYNDDMPDTDAGSFA